ncbi:MAG: hypothetical protein J5510_04150, partial [Prevotella sp.]|nr:hypothetical protein [Prevotella sp.]
SGEDGVIRPAVMADDNAEVFIIQGKVVMNEDGTAIDRKKSDENIVVRYKDGQPVMVDISEIAKLQEPRKAEKKPAAAEGDETYGTAKKTEDKQSDDNSEGVDVVAGEDKVDIGQAQGQAPVQGEEVGAPEQPVAGETPNGTEGAPEGGAKRNVYTVKDGKGGTKEIEVLPSEDEGLVKIRDGEKVYYRTKEQFNDMLAEGTPETATETTAATETPITPESPVNGNTPPAAVSDMDAPMPMMEVDGKSKPDYNKATPQRARKYLYDELGLSKEEADNFAEKYRDRAAKEFDELKNKEPRMDDYDDAEDYAAAKKDWEEKIKDAERRRDYWEEVRNPKEEAKEEAVAPVEEKAEEVQPVAEQPTKEPTQEEKVEQPQEEKVEQSVETPNTEEKAEEQKTEEQKAENATEEEKAEEQKTEESATEEEKNENYNVAPEGEKEEEEKTAATETRQERLARRRKVVQTAMRKAYEWSMKTGTRIKVITDVEDIDDDKVYNDIKGIDPRTGLKVKKEIDPETGKEVEIPIKPVRVRGWYDSKTDTVYLFTPHIKDMEAVEHVILHETVAHHGLRKLLDKDFDTLCDKVFEDMSEADKKEYLGYYDRSSFSSDEEHRRAAADEYMAEKAENADLDTSRWSRIASRIRVALRKRGFTKVTLNDKDIANLLRRSKRNLEKKAAESLMSNGADVDVNRGDVRYAVADVLDKGERDKAVRELMAVTGRSESTVRKWLQAEQSLAKVILDGDNATFLDMQVDESVPSIWNNSDYPQGTVEFSNICKKRLPFTMIYQRLQKEFPNRVFDAKTLETIRGIMKENGKDVACGLCFVEDRRQLLGEIGQGFIDALKGKEVKEDSNLTEEANAKQQKAIAKLRESGDGYIPDLYELLTLDGMKKLRKEHPAVAQAFVEYNNARCMQAGRLFQAYSAYHRDILKWNNAKVKRVNNAGGLRIFSFSDFEAHHLIDLVQVLTDCAVKGIKVQGYTKVPEFARAVKDTNMKLNRSLIAKGDGYVDADYQPQEGEAVSPNVIDGRRLLLDTVEGINVNHPDFFDSTNSKNVGNILVGINDEQIRLAMADPFVDYIIPFHSKLSQAIRDQKGIGHWKMYQNIQLERVYNDKGKLVNADKHGINIYTDVLPRGQELIGHDIRNARDFQNAFFKACEEKGWIPRFEKFINKDKKGRYVYTPGYEKLLIDFKLFDKNGKLIPQEVVKPIFDNDFNKKILDDYVRGEREKAPDDELYEKIKEGLGLNDGKRYSVSKDDVPTDMDRLEEKRKAAMDAADGVFEKARVAVEYDNRRRALEEEHGRSETVRFSLSLSDNGNYTFSNIRSGTGGRFYQNENGDIDLVDISEDVFAKMGIDKIPFRVTDAMAHHVFNQHAKELGLKTEEDAVRFIVGLMKNFDHVRKGDEINTFIFSIENGHSHITERAITLVIPYNAEEYLGIKTTGFARLKDIKKKPLLWGKGEYLSSSTGATPANVTSEGSSEGGSTDGFTSNQSKVSVGKDNTESSNLQENGEKNNNVSYSIAKDDDKVFYSNAEKAVEGIRQEKATAEQWKSMIQKSGGLKAGEDKWMGLSDWLDSKKGEKLTKQEVLDFIRENQVQIEEVTYEEGGKLNYQLTPEDLKERDEFAMKLFKESEKEIPFEVVVEDGKFRPKTDEDAEKAAVWAARYDGRGVNLKNKKRVERLVEHAMVKIHGTYYINQATEQIQNRRYYLDESNRHGSPNETRLRLTTEGLKNKKSIALTVPTVEPYHGASPEIHFDDEHTGGRAIAWIRFGETTDADGNRVLVIDEVQSQRHQDAREVTERDEQGRPTKRKGYKSINKEDEAEEKRLIENCEKTQQELDKYVRRLGEDYGLKFEPDDVITRRDIDKLYNMAMPEDKEKFEELLVASEQAGMEFRMFLLAHRNITAIPAAPFETNWHELAMKRMLRYAAENGYDKVAWTKGAQQADRYNLGEVLKSIKSSEWDDMIGDLFDEDGECKEVFAYNEDGDEVLNVIVNKEGKVISDINDTYSGRLLSDIVGKDAAVSLMKDGAQFVEGESLRIGQEGMKGFYDKMLPNFMDKYGKKWGVKT